MYGSIRSIKRSAIRKSWKSWLHDAAIGNRAYRRSEASRNKKG